jgi:hypothetical protein
MIDSSVRPVFDAASINLVKRGGVAGARAYYQLAAMGLPIDHLAGVPGVENAQKYARKLYDMGGAIISGQVPHVAVLKPDERKVFDQKLRDRGVSNPERMTEAQVLEAMRQIPGGWGSRVLQDFTGTVKQTVGVPIAAVLASSEAGHAAADLAFGKGTARASRDLQGLKQFGKNTEAYYGGWLHHPIENVKAGQVASGIVNVGLPLKGAIGAGLGGAARAGVLGAGAKRFAKMDRPNLNLPETTMGFKFDEAGHPVALPETAQALQWNQRRPYSRNLIDRVFQVQTDKLIAHSKRLSNHKVNAQAASIHAGQRSAGYRARDVASHDVLKAGRRLSRMDAKAAVGFMQGVTPEQLAAYYEVRRVPHEAEFWRRVASKNPGNKPNPQVQAWLDAAGTAIKGREQILADLPSGVALAPEEAAARSDLVRNEVQDTLRTAGHPLAEASTTQPAIYFPHAAEDQISHGGFLMRRSQNLVPKMARETKQRNELVRFRSGAWSKNLRHFEMKIARAPLLHQELKHLTTQVDTHGRAVPAGTEYDPKTTVALPVTEPHALANLTPLEASGEAQRMIAQHLADLRAEMGDHVGADELATRLFATVKQTSGTTDSAAILIPKSVWNQTTGRISRQLSSPSHPMRGLKAITDVWKYWTLYLRGGWLTHNIGGNTIQALIGGVGPVSMARALQPKYKSLVSDVAPELQNSGVWTDISRVRHLGDFENTPAGQRLRRIQESPAGRAVMGETFGNAIPGANRVPGLRGTPVNPVVAVAGAFTKANVGFENFIRRAAFLHRAIPAAKEAAGGRWTTSTTDAMNLLRQGDTEAAARAIYEGAQHVYDYSGRTDQSLAEVTRVVIPFMRWYKFIVPFTLYHLPVRVPIRNALLNQFGQWGLNQASQMGALTDSLQGALPAGDQTKQQTYNDVTGATTPHDVATEIPTQSWYSPASTFQLLGSNPNTMVPHILGNVASPWFEPVVTAAEGFNPQTQQEIYVKDTNSAGQQVNMPLSKASIGAKVKYLLHELAYSVPQAALLSPQKYGGGKGDQQPTAQTWQRVFNYLTGVNIRTIDLTLAETRQAADWIQPYKNLGTPEERKAATRIFDRLHQLINEQKTPEEQRLAAWQTHDKAVMQAYGIHAKPLKPAKPPKPAKPIKP